MNDNSNPSQMPSPSVQEPEVKKENFADVIPKAKVSNELDVESNSDEVKEEKVKIEDPSENSSVVEIAKMSKSGIKVVADRKGFYNQSRIFKGDKFVVKSFKALGEWMICEDPTIEKKRKEFFKDKKANV